MKVKDEVDLANVLGMAFSGYANRVQNGAVAPYLGFLKGESFAVVNVWLNDDGSVTVSPNIVEQIEVPVEPPVLEAVEDESDANVPELEAEIDIIEKPMPKRKRKR
jgi:hypothetical protein